MWYDVTVLHSSILFYPTDLDVCQDDPFCRQFCHLSSRSLTIATDVSECARIKLTEIGFVTSLLQSLEKFASLPFTEVSLDLVRVCLTCDTAINH